MLSKSPNTAAECVEYADLYFTISKIGKETDRPDLRRHGQAEGPPRFVRPNNDIIVIFFLSSVFLNYKTCKF